MDIGLRELLRKLTLFSIMSVILVCAVPYLTDIGAFYLVILATNFITVSK